MTPNKTPARSSLTRKTLVLFLVIFVLEALYLGTVASLIVQTKSQFEKECKTREAIGAIGQLMSATQSILIDLIDPDFQSDPEVQALYKKDLAELDIEKKNLKQVLGSDKKYSETVDETIEACSQLPAIGEGLRTEANVLRAPVVLSNAKKVYLGNADWARLFFVYQEVVTRLKLIQDDYKQIEREVVELLQTQSSFLINVTLVLGFIISAGATLLFYQLFISAITRRLRTVSDDIIGVAMGKTPQAMSSETDEIGTLSLELCKMASTLAEFRTKERTLLENAASLICTIDEKGVLLKVSPACMSLWGYRPDELIGRRLSSLIRQEDIDETVAKIESIFKGTPRTAFENSLKRKDGSVIELAWKGRLAEDKQLAIFIAQDVTKRNEALRLIKRSQEELRGIVDRMPISVVTCDGSFVITSVNPATEEMFHFRALQLLGKNLSELLTGTQMTGSSIGQLEDIMTVAEKQPVELNAWQVERTTLPVELNARHYKNEESENYLATFRDVSARLEIERVKKDFVAMISHDLRSPLTALHGTLDMMVLDTSGRTDRTGEEPNENDATIIKAKSVVEEIVHLLNDFLDMEKFESGMRILDLAEVPLIELVRETLDRSQLQQPAAIKISIAPDSDRIVKVDRDRLVFALSNILRLVYHYSSKTAPVQVTLDTSERLVQMTIKGSNARFPQSVRDALFSRYVFLADIGVATSSGLALGLSRATVEGHGGHFKIESQSEADVVSIAF